MVNVNGKVDSEVCEKGICVFYTVFVAPQFRPLLLSGALPFSAKHVTAQPIGTWAYGRPEPNRKAHLVLLIATTAGGRFHSFQYQAFPSSHGRLSLLSTEQPALSSTICICTRKANRCGVPAERVPSAVEQAG
jgi:hypothetical protein